MSRLVFGRVGVVAKRCGSVRYGSGNPIVGGGYGIVRNVTPPRTDEELEELVEKREKESVESNEKKQKLDAMSDAEKEAMRLAEERRKMRNRWNSNAPAGPEWGGPPGYEPTRYGDWAKNGRVSDF